MSDVWHVAPVRDVVAHDTNSTCDCVCGPQVERMVTTDGSKGVLVTHHSLDGREESSAATADGTRLRDRTAGSVGLCGGETA